MLYRRLVLATVFLAAASAGAQCPPAVQPTTPSNGLVTTETHINFAWSPAGSAVTGYDLFLSANGGAFQTICLASPSPNCSATLTTGRYEWFVRNYRNDCQRGTESAHFRFEVAACSAPVAPETLAPDGGVEVPASGTTLSWSGGSADSYDVFLEQGSACSTTTALGRTSGTSLSSGPLVRGATYAWRVRASRGSTCPAPVFSHCATFKVRPCDPPASFALTSPGAGSSAPQTVKLQWTAAAGATNYNVYANSVLIGSTTSTSLYAVFPPSSTVEWYVDAISGACTTTTAHRTFTIAGCDVGTATLLAPSGTLTPGSAINFRWSSARNAELYRVWLAPSGGTFAPIDETIDTAATAHRPPGAYDWYVEAIGRSCPSTTSATGHFVVPKANACPTPPSSLAATGANDVTFSWTGNANRYELWASINHAAATRIASTTATSYTTDLAAGAIEWFVLAKADGCDDARSATATFTKQNACDNGVPLLLAPASGAQRIPTGVDFFWTNVAGASTYRLWSAIDDGAPALLATTTSTRAHADVPAGRIRWFVEAVIPNCGSSRSPEEWFRTAASSGCALPDAPSISAPAGVPAGTTFELHWTPLPNIDHYEIQRDATVLSTLLSTRDVMLAEKFDVTSATSVHYRVRGVSSCGAGTGPFSNELVVTITPNGTNVPYGTAEVRRTLFVPGAGPNVRFTATANRPWIIIEPASGILPPEGITLTLRFLASQLDAGDHQASIRIDTAAAGKTGISNGSTTTPVSVSVVTPVTPSTATTATPSSLILPAVAHLDAATSFHSDMRLLNSGARPLRYLLTYVAAGTDGTKSAQSTSVQVNGGASIALNDLLSSFFGTGNSFGSLEIRPVTAAGDFAPPGDVTFASSRTYALTALGTAGQFIPALPLSKFGSNTTQLLAQVTQRGAFRTNVGLVEGGAQNATVVLHFFNKNGFEMGSSSYDLPPRGLLQLDSLIKSDSFLADVARIEVASSGRVTAYASILDQATNDPMLIQAVPLASIGATRYTVPGVAALISSGGTWRSDLQIDNLSSLPLTLSITFWPRDNPDAGRSAVLTLKEKEVRVFADVLRSLFDQTSASGSALVYTDLKSQLAVTTRTYFDNGSGTYGQYIPALTPADGAILGGRAREVLQVEQSDRYRTNLGVVELSGTAPATVEIIANVPELKSSPVIALTLRPYEFRQLDSILASLGFSDVHNARLSIRVISGAGSVGAYASLVDSLTGDPTLIPAQ